MHYRHALTAEHEDTDAMLLGRVAHLATFEPHKLETDVVVWDGRRAGGAWEEFKAQHADKEIVKPLQLKTAIQIATSARRAAGRLLSEGNSEETLRWSDEETGIAMKGRVDHISNGFGIIDLKTCTDARPTIFGARAASLSYHVQASMYVDGAERSGFGRLPYTLLAVESKPPYAATLYTMTEDQLELGQEIYRGWLSLLAHCERTGIWPSYPPGVLTLPSWADLDPYDEDASGFGLTFGGNDNG
jgi:exodeoxyribonuclease VIII